MPKPSDGRSSQAIAFEWAFTVMTIALEMVVPGLLGYWLDQRLGTKVVFLLLGFLLGAALAGMALARIAGWRKASKADQKNGKRQKDDDGLGSAD